MVMTFNSSNPKIGPFESHWSSLRQKTYWIASFGDNGTIEIACKSDDDTRWSVKIAQGDKETYITIMKDNVSTTLGQLDPLMTREQIVELSE